MNLDVTKGTAIVGNSLTLFLCILITSSIYCQAAGLSHPLEGGVIAAGVFLGSPLVALFQVLAIIMTRKSEFKRLGRIVVFSLNILGLIISLWMVMMLFFFIRMGPINPG